MDKLPVGQLPDLASSNNDDEIMVITNSEYNQLKKEKIADFITDLASTDENNAIVKGADGKLFTKDFGNASNITEGTLPVSVLPDIPKDLLPAIETSDLPVSGVTADTYAYPSSVTVNAQGQVTAIEEGTPSSSNANVDLSNITDAGKEVIKENSGGSGLEIGDIGIAPLGIDETEGKRRYLNGQLIIQEQYVQFTNKVKSAVALYPSLACTESEWQATALLTVGGQVGKFVVDNDAGTIRLPKIIMPIQGLTDLSKLGEIVEAGLPNIEGDPGISALSYNTPSGAFNSTKVSIASYNPSTSRNEVTLNFDASLSNPIFGNSNTVQPEAIQYPYFIQVATGAETEDNIINEIELNNPFSLLDYKYSEYELNNLSWLRSQGQYNAKAIYPAVYDLLLKIYNGTETKAGVSVKLSTETFTDYDFVLNTAEETFRLPIKVKLASGKAVVGNGKTLGLTDGKYLLGLDAYVGSQNFLTTNSNLYGADVGMTVTPTNRSVGGGVGITTDPTKSGAETSDNGLYLYFYVGETVQNANLINAGRIEEKITDINSRPYITETYENGTSGYVVYSNGLCEQWGVQSAAATGSETTIELLKPYKDINYIALKTFSISTNTQAFYRYINIYSKTVNNFKTGNTSGIENWSWFTKGYIS